MRKATAEMEIKISNARITNVNTRILPNGSCKLEFELAKPIKHYIDRGCILINASKLSLTDEFMSHEPGTEPEDTFKENLTKVIKSGITDFYKPIMDPSFANKACNIIYHKAGDFPADGKSYNWWEKNLEDSEWSLGTKSQYIAFLGVLIKKLVASGWSVKDAWHAVCNNSKKLGNYRDDTKHEYEYERTGSREVCDFFDLANTYKILAKDEEAGGFWLAGGDYNKEGWVNPLADLELSCCYDETHWTGVPWLVRKPDVE